MLLFWPDARAHPAPSAFCPKHAMADQLRIPDDELDRIMGHIRLEVRITQNVEKRKSLWLMAVGSETRLPAAAPSSPALASSQKAVDKQRQIIEQFAAPSAREPFQGMLHRSSATLRLPGPPCSREPAGKASANESKRAAHQAPPSPLGYEDGPVNSNIEGPVWARLGSAPAGTVQNRSPILILDSCCFRTCSGAGACFDAF